MMITARPASSPAGVALLLWLALAVAGVCQAESGYEQEPVLDATAFAAPSLLSGPAFSVDSRVEIRGYMARFTLQTPAGPMHADSSDILVERVSEIPAMQAVEQLTRSDAFVTAAKNSFVDTAQSIGQVLIHPLDTVIGIPSGVARYFGRRLDKLGDQAQRLSDRAAHQFGSDGDPYPNSDGPMRAAAAADALDPDDDDVKKKKKRWFDRAGDEIEREVKRRAKFSQVKRDLAERLHIDPYTTNPYLRERLDALAWVGSGGHYAAASALAAVGGVGAVVLDQGNQLNDLVWKLDPVSLRDTNHERLRAWCTDELLMRQFLRRGVFTPSLQTALIDALQQLSPASGCDALLELGMTARSELEARFVVNALRAIVAELDGDARHGRLTPIGAGIAYVTARGELLLPLPVDYLVWTAEVEQFLDRAEFRVSRKTVMIRGEGSPRTLQELTERGWNIRLGQPKVSD